MDTETCSRCGKDVATRRVRIIDGEPVCVNCLFGNVEPYEMYPIGYVRRDADNGEQSLEDLREETCRIELSDTMRQFMRGLADEDHVTVVWVLHEAEGIPSEFNRRVDDKYVGMFAARTPKRLNPIAVTTVELLRVEDTTLFVRGLDAFDGSPVLDLKVALGGCRD